MDIRNLKSLYRVSCEKKQNVTLDMKYISVYKNEGPYPILSEQCLGLDRECLIKQKSLQLRLNKVHWLLYRYRKLDKTNFSGSVQIIMFGIFS